MVEEMGHGGRGRGRGKIYSLFNGLYPLVVPLLPDCRCNETNYLTVVSPCLQSRAFSATLSWPHLPHHAFPMVMMDCPVGLWLRIKSSSLNRLLVRHLVTAMSGYCTRRTCTQRNCHPCGFGRIADAVAGSHEQILHGGKVGSRLLPLPTGKRFILIYKAAQLCVIIP